MTAATVTEYVQTGLPSIEVVRLTATNDETYVSRKFETILGAIATANVDDGTLDLEDIQVSFSSGTATIHCASASDSLMTLVLFGKHT